MEKYFDICGNGRNIRCKLYCRPKEEITKAILYVHGFAGHKDTAAAGKFAERVLSKYKDVSVLVFDLPCHGNDVRKKLSLADCTAYIEDVIGYIRSEMHVEDIYAYAVSFGGYLTLLYMAEHGNPFRKTALRCPAVNMAEILTSVIMTEDDLDRLEKGKNVLVGFDRMVEVSRQFLAELESADIRKHDFTELCEDILIIHGTDDEIVPFADSRQFADDNIIEFVPVEKADHRFRSPACMEAATKAILSFFAF